MKPKNFVVSIILFLLTIYPAYGMDRLLRTLSYQKLTYETDDDTTTEDNIEALLRRPQTVSGATTVLSYCLHFPRQCHKRDLLNYFAPNHYVDGKLLVHHFIDAYKSSPSEHDKKYFHALILKLIKSDGFNPHHPYAVDVVPEVFQLDSQRLAKALVASTKFNPNQLYNHEGKNIPLATLLFKRRKLRHLSLIFLDPRFNSSSGENRPSYFLLMKKNPLLFKQSMGVVVDAWDLSYLDLDERARFEKFFFTVLDDDHLRIKMFEKFINQVVLREGSRKAKNYTEGLRKIFNAATLINDTIVNEKFNYHAKRLLVQYGVITEKEIREHQDGAFWLSIYPQELLDSTIKFENKARKIMQIVDLRQPCSHCQSSGHAMLFKSSLWCDHVFCFKCLFEHFLGAKDKFAHCPVVNCERELSPLTIAAVAFSDVGSAAHSVDTWSQIFRNYHDHHRDIREEYFRRCDKMIRCPQCSLPVFVDVSKGVRIKLCQLCGQRNFLAANSELKGSYSPGEKCPTHICTQCTQPYVNWRAQQ